MKETRTALVFEASREAYSIEQATDRRAMTVGELIQILDDYDEDDLIILSHDRGYTYGTIRSEDMIPYSKNEDGEWEPWGDWF